MNNQNEANSKSHEKKTSQDNIHKMLNPSK